MQAVGWLKCKILGEENGLTKLGITLFDGEEVETAVRDHLVERRGQIGYIKVESGGISKDNRVAIRLKEPVLRMGRQISVNEGMFLARPPVKDET